MKAELVPENGDPPIPITRDVTVIGRREFCDIVVNDPSLSKRHCVLIKTDGLLVIRDLATTNGTKVKGQRIRWAALLPDDRITLGSFKFRVYLGSDDSPSPSEAAQERGTAPRSRGRRRPSRPAAKPAKAAAPMPARNKAPAPAPAPLAPPNVFWEADDSADPAWPNTPPDDDLIIELD